MEDILQCLVCGQRYDAGPHRPLMLPACGHTYCKQCLSSSKLAVCPEDRCSIPDVSQLPDNKLVLRSLCSAQQSPIPGIAEGVQLIRSEDVQLHNKIGEGGSGQVWQATYKHKTVAVKIFSIDLPPPGGSATSGSGPSSSYSSSGYPAMQPITTTSTSSTTSTTSSSFGGSMCASSDPLLRAFVKEVELLQLVSVDSMYCCRLDGVMVKDNKPCIVMKWFGHGHLQVPMGGYDLSSALQWGLAIAKALADVHALGIVVADLKPENVLISDQGDPVLADFGISRRVSTTLATLTQGRSNKTTTTQTIKGTPYYMSPEQWSASKLTNRSDIWSWGCLMLELMTGAPPWLGLNMLQVANKVHNLHATPQLPPALPESLTNLLASCFKHTPASRPSAAQLVAELRDYNVLWVSLSLEHPTICPATPCPDDLSLMTSSMTSSPGGRQLPGAARHQQHSISSSEGAFAEAAGRNPHGRDARMIRQTGPCNPGSSRPGPSGGQALEPTDSELVAQMDQVFRL